MLESILFLLVGILFIILVLAYLGKKVDVIRCIILAASVFFVLYTIVASALIIIEKFSVNRSLMLMDVLLAVAAALMVIRKRKHKLSWSLNLKTQILPLIVCVIFAVISVGVINDGFFGMDNILGVTQAKAINLASKSDISPFVAEYLSKLDGDTLAAVNEATAQLASNYEHYNVPFTALLAFGAYFFGYAEMSFVLVITGMCLIYLFWCFLGNIKLPFPKFRRIVRLAGQALLGAVIVAVLFLAFGRKTGKVVLEWKELQDLDRIISEYDTVILDQSIMDKYYVPVAGVTRAKVYPCYASIEEVIGTLHDSGERVYYISPDVISSDEIDAKGLLLKNVYHNDSDVLYGNITFYKTHKEYDYLAIKERILIAVFLGLSIFALIMFFAAVFKGFDTALNLMLSTALTLGMYSLVSWFLISINAYTISYAAAVTMTIALLAFAAVIYSGVKMEFSYKARKSVILMIIVAVILIVMGKSMDGNLYATYRALGRNQIWALKYIYDSPVPLANVEQVPMLSSLMALFGRMFGVKDMVMVIAVFAACAAAVIFVVFERVINFIPAVKRNKKASFIGYIIINAAVIIISCIGTSGFLKVMSQKDTIAEWNDIIQFTKSVEPDASVAIQRSLYDTYRYPIQIMTGVSTCLRAYDYDDSAEKLSNTGRDTFYLTTEVKDPSFDRVKVVVHKSRMYLYKTHDYLTDRGIYSVADSVNQGFHDIDFSGMAWTSDQNSFIQCDIPYRKYDTIRLYLGSEIKLKDINIEYIDLEFRENWYYVGKARIDEDNNGKYIDFKLNWDYMIDGYNVIYFHCGAMWSPLIYGDKDIRVMGFPFYYIRFLNTENQAAD